MLFMHVTRFNQLLAKENDVSITRLVYLISNVINIFGHMCLHCAIGEFLMAQVSLAFSVIKYITIIILKKDFLIFLSAIEFITLCTIKNGIFWKQAKREI